MPTLDMNPMKRRRTELEKDDSNPVITRAGVVPLADSVIAATRSDIWFEDGSVVLQAENVQFKVHRTLLSRHSPIFVDVFEMPHPKDEPTVDGCPVLHLQDSAEDIRQILLALYDKSYNTRAAIPYKMVAAMIRLGRKYEINHLQNEGLVRLSMEFPTKLEEWEKLPHFYTQICEEPEDGLLFDIINLAHQNDIKSILPAAYYLCLQDIETMLAGTVRGDGSTTHISYDVKHACILGREKLLRAQAVDTFGWVNDVGGLSGCLHPNRCASVSSHLTKVLWKPMPEPARTLEKWSDFVRHIPVKSLCAHCTKYAKEAHEEGRQRIWDQLPSYFGLPEWDELKDFES